MIAMRRSLIAGALVVFALLATWFTWRQLQPAARPPKTSGQPLRVVRGTGPGHYWVELADRQGWFQDAGLPVELSEPQPGQPPFAALAAGTVDAEPGPLFDLIRARLQDADLVMVLACDHSAGADGIVSREEIESVQGLRGKRIGVSRGTQAEYLLSMVLQRRGLRLQDVVLVDLSGQALVNAFAFSEIDATAASEPLLSDAQRRGGGRRLFDTSQVPGMAPNGYAVRRELVERRPADLQAFVGVWHRATTFLREHPAEAFALLAEAYQKTPGTLQAAAQRARILGLRDNLTAFTYAAGFESLHGAARYINAFFLQQGLTDQQLDSTEFLDAQFLRTLRL